MSQREEIDACARLKSKGLSRKEISEHTGLTERQVKRRLALGANGDVNKTRFGREVVASVKNGADDYSSVWDSGDSEFSFPLDKDDSLYSHEKGNKKREAIKSMIEAKYIGQKVKILYLADLHIPFARYQQVLEVINNNLDSDIVVINGDMLDLFAVSKFAKDKEIALRRELEEGREFLEYLSKRFKDIIITEGNHERRLKSYIKSIIPIDMQFLFPDDVLEIVQTGSSLNKEPLKNVHVVGSWWIKIFETIIAHPDNYTNANLKTAQNTSEFFSIIKGIPHKACIIGHTHRAGKIVSGDVLIMETGCLCFEMDYHSGSKFTRTKWTNAYAIIMINEDGTPDFNKTDVEFL